VESSSGFQLGSVFVENPTPAGLSKNSIFAYLFHDHGFSVNYVSPDIIVYGPSSCIIPINEEHPGPPFSQRTTGSFEGLEALSMNT